MPNPGHHPPQVLPVPTTRARVTAVVVVVPAHNEQARITACLVSVEEAVAELRRAEPDVAVQVTVVLDGCSDGTAAAVARLPGVTSLAIEARSVGAARRAGVRHAVASLGRRDSAEVLVVNTDADCVVPPTWILDHWRLAADHDLVLGEVEPDPAEAGSALLAAWWQAHPAGRESLLHGANLAVRLDAYLAAGEFSEVDHQEDVLLVRALRAQGALVIGGTRIITSARLVGRAPLGFADYLRNLDSLQQPGPAHRVEDLMYFDTKLCQVCGATVDLHAHDGSEPRQAPDPDGTVDERVCSNASCPTNLSDDPSQVP